MGVIHWTSLFLNPVDLPSELPRTFFINKCIWSGLRNDFQFLFRSWSLNVQSWVDRLRQQRKSIFDWQKEIQKSQWGRKLLGRFTAVNGKPSRSERKKFVCLRPRERIEQILMDNYSRKLTLMSYNRNAYYRRLTSLSLPFLWFFCLFIFSVPGKYFSSKSNNEKCFLYVHYLIHSELFGIEQRHECIELYIVRNWNSLIIYLFFFLSISLFIVSIDNYPTV